MINEVLKSVARELNTHLLDKYKTAEQKVVMDLVIDQNGTIPERCLNKIVFSVVNVAPDFKTQHGRNPIGYRPEKNSQTDASSKAPVNYDLDLLVTASFSNYEEGLKLLSDTIDFFYHKPVFNSPNETLIEKLTLEVVNLSYLEKQSLWGAIGAKYMPSVLFRVKMVRDNNSTAV
jgi:hypothetical protein